MGFELPSKELLEEALSASANATTKIVFLVVIGVIATANGVFNDQGVSDLGRLVYYITLPSLLFVNILREVTVARLRILWKLPAMALLHVSTGFLLARCLTRALGIRGIGKKAVTLCMMFGNVGALSIAVINTLCQDEPLKSGVGPTCSTRGVEYISFYLITQNILMFTWAEEIVKDHSDEDEEEEDDDDDGEGTLDHVSAAALPYLQQQQQQQGGNGERSELLSGDGDVEEEGETATARPRPASQPQAIVEVRRKGSYVRFHDDADGAQQHDGGAVPIVVRRSRVGSLDGGRPAAPGALPQPPPPASLAASYSGGAGQGGRLKRFYSQPSILDPEDINSLLSRYPVESRPSLDPDASLLSSTSGGSSSTGHHLLPFLAATSPRSGGGLFRRRSSSRLLAMQQQQQQEPPLAATGPVPPPPPAPQSLQQPTARAPQEGDYLLGGAAAAAAKAGGASPERRRSMEVSSSAAAATAAAAAAAGQAAGGGGEEVEPPLTWGELACDRLALCGDATWAVLGRMCGNPSIRAAMVAFALGIVPPVKALFVGGDGEGANDPPLGAFTGAIEILGSAQVPCSMLMLSGSGTIRYLNDRAAKSEVQQPFAFSPKTVLCIIAGRVLLFPLLGLLWWWAGFELRLFQDVPVLSLVVLLDAAVPTAQNIVMLILVHGKPEHGHALAYVLLWQYALCIPMLILNVTLYLAIVKQAYPI